MARWKVGQSRKWQEIQCDHAVKVARMCADMNLVMPEPEYKFCEGRKWRFDWAWLKVKVALELEGGILSGFGNWKKRGHTTSVSVFLRNMEKYNAAASMGWIVLRASTLEKPIFASKKITKSMTHFRDELPWMALADPAFRKLLSAALASRNGLSAQEV